MAWWTLWKRLITRDFLALFFAIRDKRVPLSAKIVSLFAIVYALSPIDFISDFLPVLGLVDDVIVVAFFTYLAEQLIAPNIFEEHRIRSAHLWRILKYVLTGIVITWVVTIVFIIALIYNYRA